MKPQNIQNNTKDLCPLNILSCGCCVSRNVAVDRVCQKKYSEEYKKYSKYFGRVCLAASRLILPNNIQRIAKNRKQKIKYSKYFGRVCPAGQPIGYKIQKFE